MEMLIVAAIVTTAVVFIALRAWKSFSKSKRPAAGCANCEMSPADSDDWAK
jgi:hypothetical protein